MDYIGIMNWDKWQSYRKDRGQPPWIKIHRRVMRNPEWVSLTDAERGQLVAMWLLAADHNGVIPASPEIVQRLCFMTDEPNFNKFISLGFLASNGCHYGVNVASTGSQHVTPKAEAEKNRIKNICSSGDELFEVFWKNYPRKVGKQAALKVWKRIPDHKTVIEKMKIVLPKQKNSTQWTKDNGQFIPLPTTYLNQGRWEDETIE